MIRIIFNVSFINSDSQRNTFYSTKNMIKIMLYLSYCNPKLFTPLVLPRPFERAAASFSFKVKSKANRRSREAIVSHTAHQFLKQNSQNHELIITTTAMSHTNRNINFHCGKKPLFPMSSNGVIFCYFVKPLFSVSSNGV